MEQELKAAFPSTRVSLIRGSGGIFEILMDNKLIYSKARTGRFPNAGEITDIIENLT
ncbi:Rdx family protein [candidate division KSB1 bacterium]|nr:Rdx family protein [candidate division KSB1 bacterium]